MVSVFVILVAIPFTSLLVLNFLVGKPYGEAIIGSRVYKISLLQSDFENVYGLHSLNRSGTACKTSRQLQHDLADSREKQYVQQYRL